MEPEALQKDLQFVLKDTMNDKRDSVKALPRPHKEANLEGDKSICPGIMFILHLMY
jgi:hypothetical protein